MNNLSDSIAAHLGDGGDIPEGGNAVEVGYIVMARIRVLHADGRVDTVYRPIVSSSIEPDSYLGLANMMLDKAKESARSWG